MRVRIVKFGARRVQAWLWVYVGLGLWAFGYEVLGFP